MQKTKDVDYNLVKMRSVRTSTEKTKHYPVQEDRSSRREEKSAVIQETDRSKEK